MARARNIKPGFAKNEDLAECSIAARLCFALLPTLADREGRLEDRPKRIKGELFAFDSIEVEPLLVELESRGFIARYVAEGRGLIQIVAFHKHQNPHHREPESTLPPHPSLRLDADGKWAAPEATPPSQPPEAPDKPGLSPPRSDLPPPLSRVDSGARSTEHGFRSPDTGARSTDTGGEPSPPVPSASRAGSACMAMKARGLIVGLSPGHPKLLALLAAGITDDELADAAADAVAKGKPFAYALATAEGRRRDAAVRNLPARRSPTTTAERNAEAKRLLGFEEGQPH
jgi:hypothetical protein